MISKSAIASIKWRNRRHLKRTTMHARAARIGNLNRCGNALSPNERKRALTPPPTASSGRSPTEMIEQKKRPTKIFSKKGAPRIERRMQRNERDERP